MKKNQTLYSICYALTIKLVDGTSSAHSFNPYAYFGHSWSYFDIQNLRLVILYVFMFLLHKKIINKNKDI